MKRRAEILWSIRRDYRGLVVVPTSAMNWSGSSGAIKRKEDVNFYVCLSWFDSLQRLMACSFIFNPYKLKGINMDWKDFNLLELKHHQSPLIYMNWGRTEHGLMRFFQLSQVMGNGTDGLPSACSVSP
jgi:hypothetical protein